MFVKISNLLIAFVATLMLVVGSAESQSAQPGGTFLVMGDSLSAAYGLPAEQGWVALLRQHWKDKYPDIDVVNVSVSGATTADGLHNLPRQLAHHKPAWVLIELGGNDGLQGKPIPYIRKNLEKLITLAAQQGDVFVVGMRLPPNLGARYTQPFFEMYERLSLKYSTGYDPFLLDGVAATNHLMQKDGIHPNAEGQTRIFTRMEPILEAWLSSSSGQSKQDVE